MPKHGTRLESSNLNNTLKILLGPTPNNNDFKSNTIKCKINSVKLLK